MPTIGTALIMRTDLSTDCQHIPGGGIQIHEDGAFCNHRKQVHRTGKARYFQSKAVELLAVIAVRELG